MAHDTKYGEITIEGIPEDEPVIVFRAQDEALLPMLNFYAQTCRAMGSPPNHLAGIENVIRAFSVWQANNPTKVPD